MTVCAVSNFIGDCLWLILCLSEVHKGSSFPTLELHLACKKQTYVCSPSDMFSETQGQKYWMHRVVREQMNHLLQPSFLSPLHNVNLIYAVLFHHYSNQTWHSKWLRLLMVIPFLCPISLFPCSLRTNYHLSFLLSLCICSSLALHQPLLYEANPACPAVSATALISEVSLHF